MKLLVVKKEFIKELNKNIISKEFLEKCRKAGRLFNKNTEENKNTK